MVDLNVVGENPPGSTRTGVEAFAYFQSFENTCGETRGSHHLTINLRREFI